MPRIDRRGRPTKPGDRYASGRRRPNIEPTPPALWQRIKAHARKLLGSPDIASEIGRLSFAGELTAAQVVTGLYIAKVCGNFEALKGSPRRSARSPSYDAGYGGGSVDRAEYDPEHVPPTAEHACGCPTCTRIRDAETAWKRLQDKIPFRMRAVIEQLCVEDRAVNPTVLEDVRLCLDQIAQDFGITRLRAGPGGKLAGRGSKSLDRHAPLHFNGHLEEEPAGTETVQVSTVERPPSPDRVAWLKCVGVLRPDLDTAQLIDAYEIMVALRNRERFNQEKARGKSAVR